MLVIVVLTRRTKTVPTQLNFYNNINKNPTLAFIDLEKAKLQ